MGTRNMRAICPNCGGKIHTQPKGLGHLTWANNWFLVQTGTTCQDCGVALSGKVGADNRAILAEDADKSWWDRQTKKARQPAAGHYVVTIKSVPKKQRVKTIQRILAASNLGLKQAKTLVDDPPSEVSGLSPDAAENLATELVDIGVEIDGPVEHLTPTDESGAAESPSADDDPTEVLRKLGDLRDAGVLTEKEFAAKKAELLDRI